MPDLFEKRIRRAEALEKQWPFAAEILGFFKSVTAAQRTLCQNFSEMIPRDPGGHDLHLLRPFLPIVLDLLEKKGPQQLSRRVPELRGWEYADWLDYLTITRAGQEGSVLEGDPMDDPACWCASKILLQPYLMSLIGAASGAPPTADPPQRCPSCDGRPLVSLLREDKIADTVRRSLICSLCSREWDFPRVSCPGCREEKTEKLPRYSAQEIPWMRVEACDTCGKYLKSVDLTLNWEAEPGVDELASTPLDVIAHEHGYEKITPNLAGV